MRASACAKEGRQREEQAAPPPQGNKNRGGRGGGGAKTAHSHQTARQHHQRGPTPPPEGTEDRTPEKARGDHPAKTGNTKPGTAAHREKGRRNMQTHSTEKKKEPAPQPERRGMGGQGPQGPGQGHQAKKEAQKKHPDDPATKGWAQPRPEPSTHAHTARWNRKRRGASGARTRPHTSHKQAETEPQPRTPQTTDTRGTTPQTVPKRTHPRPQPGLAGLTKPTTNRKPDPNTNAAQQ